MKGQQRIEEMFAFVVLDDDGTEGVPAVTVNMGPYEGDMSFPLLGADMARIESLRPHAVRLSKQMGKKVTLCKFTNREEMEVFEP